MVIQLTYHVRRGDRGRTFITAARWMKVHIYTGYVVIALFLITLTQFFIELGIFLTHLHHRFFSTAFEVGAAAV